MDAPSTSGQPDKKRKLNEMSVSKEEDEEVVVIKKQEEEAEK